MRFWFSIWLLTSLVSFASRPEGTTPVTLISAPTLSPDGRTMAFEWVGDLWIGSTEGGEVKRLTRHSERDAYPKFTADGKRIVFSSDRSGSLQVYSMPASGGKIRRHSHHTEGNELECLSPDGSKALVRGLRERSGFRASRLLEIDLTTSRRERLLFDATAHSAAWSPDGTQVLFCRGGEQLYRKGYRGSRASQIWLFDRPTRTFKALVQDLSEARSPQWLPSGNGFLYVSTRSGTANLWITKNDQAHAQLTHFTDDGVISPELSADGSTVVFRKGFDVFTLALNNPPSKPSRLDLWTRETVGQPDSRTLRVTGTSSADFSPDLSQVVFTAADDLWWIPNPKQKPIQLTHSPAAENHPYFSPNGDWLYFLRDDGLNPNYFRARLVQGTLREEIQVTEGPVSKNRFKLSADGSHFAWIEGTGKVFTANADGKNPHKVFESWDMPSIDWSPCGRWLAIAAKDQHSNRDIWLVAADGSGQPVNLTAHPAFDGSPRWSPNGRWLAFTSRRSVGEKLELWRMDLNACELSKTPTPHAATSYGDTAERIPTKGIQPTRIVWSADSTELWFQSAAKSSKRLYAINPATHELRILTRKRGLPIRVAPNGSLLWRVDRTPEALAAANSTRFPINLKTTRSRREQLTIGFRRIWRTLGERFYDPGMSGTNWEIIRKKYEPAAIGSLDSRQFDRVISQLFGELNASHLSFLRQPWFGETQPKRHEPATAHTGMVFANPIPGDDALRIVRVIQGSPVSQLPNPPLAGESITHIAGQPVTADSPLHTFLNGTAGKSIPAVVRSCDGKSRSIEIPCLSYSRTRWLDRREREQTARSRVKQADPKTAYLWVPNMSRSTLDQIAVAIYRASLEADRLVFDLRNNGGGRETDRMLSMFCQPAHSTTTPRNGPGGYPLDRRPAPAWTKPFVVLCNQNTFSNSEIFCHAVKQTKLAPLVGTATAGGVISAVKVRIPDTGELQVPFRGWYHAHTGANLDLNGAQPDHPVDLTPADEDAGRDPQLDAALKALHEPR